MPNNTTYLPVTDAWVGFVKSVQIVLVPRSDDRPLDQFLEFRDAVISLVLDQKFLGNLDSAIDKFAAAKDHELMNVLLLELQAFPRSVEVAKSLDKGDEQSIGWWDKLLGRASTITGSVKDVAEKNPYAKAATTLFKEAIDIYRGKG